MLQPVSVVRRVVVTLFLCPALGIGQQVPTLTLTPELRIDAAEQDLSPISWIAVARNGTIAASQFQDNRVAFFDARGQSLGTFGRTGEGPGEFRRPAQFGWLGDTLWINDPATRRLTLIGPDRTLARTVPWLTAVMFEAAPAQSPQFFWILPRALYRDGTMLVEAVLNRDSPPIPWPGGTRDGTPLVRVAADGRFQRVAFWPPPRGCSVAFALPGGSGAVTIPFCTAPLTDFASDGSRFALATAEDVGDRSGYYRVLVVDERGDTLLNRRYPFGPVAIPKRIADSVIAQRTGGRAQPEFIAAYRSMKLPTTFPPLERIVLGRDATTWIEHYTFSGNRTWSMLDRSGQPIGWLVIPRNIRLQEVSRDLVWATETDEDGLQHVVRFRVTGARGS